MKIWITRLILFIAMAGLLLYMGHRPTQWEYWAVIACRVGIGVVEYFNGKGKENDFSK